MTEEIIEITLAVPKNKVHKLRKIADRMCYEVGLISFTELQALEQFRCIRCGEVNLKGNQCDIGYICKDC